MMVPRRQQQAAVMMEAVCNHSPEVIIVDEIATKEVRAAARKGKGSCSCLQSVRHLLGVDRNRLALWGASGVTNMVC
jgi:hypothetical protein